MSHMAEVWIDDFDTGLIKTLGSTFYQYAVDEGTRPHWVIDFSKFPVRRDVNGTVTTKDFKVRGPPDFGGTVPVYFVIGSPSYSPKFYPCVVIRRVGVDIAPENGSQAYSMKAQPAKDAAALSLTLPNGTVLNGYSHHEIRPQAFPHNVSYEISIRARGTSAQQQANRMWQAMSRVVEPRGFTVNVTDSDGDERGYDAFIESQTPNTEVLDLTGRGAGYTLSVIVHGELDMAEPYDVVTLQATPTLTLTTLDN